MTEYYIPNLGVVQAGQAFRLDGRQFNAKWLAGANDADKAAIGAVVVQRDPVPAYDPRTERLVESAPGPVISYEVEPLDGDVIAAALSSHQASASDIIDAAAEQARARFITPGSGQAMVYQAKTQEAAAWLAAESPSDLTGFPFIAAEVGITAATAADLVALWQTMESGWRQAAAGIEAARMAGKVAVGAVNADDFEDAGEAFDAVDAARESALAILNSISP